MTTEASKETKEYGCEKLSEYEPLKKEREEYSIFTRRGNGDYWGYTICNGCYSSCGIRVRVVNGCPVKVEGIPGSDMGSRGGVCAKSLANIMDYHDPNRCNYPVKRANPRKGIHEDPKWQRISWEEALDTIAKKLIAARDVDPRTILWGTTPLTFLKGGLTFRSFMNALGSTNVVSGGYNAFCGNANLRVAATLTHTSSDIVPDYRYCNYLIRSGGNEGFGSGHTSNVAMRQAADARDRGMKMMVLDPIGYLSGGKATEWVPILPATDSAVFLAMANLIVNEIGIYDREYIRNKTNGPYLVHSGRLLRDKENRKPLLWDEKDAAAKTYDDPTLTYPALEGEYSVYGVRCAPAFQLLREHLKKYDPVWASNVSTVPENVIRRLASELIQEARIGSTIEIQGIKFPYRPACVVGYKGITTHQNGCHQAISLMLLNTLLGNQDVPGGALAVGMVRSFGFPETGCPSLEPYAGDDGMLTSGSQPLGSGVWPPNPIKEPSLIDFRDIFPYSFANPYPYCDDWDEIWDNVGRPYEPAVFALYGANVAINCVNPNSAENFLKKVPFIFSINTIHNETTEGFADVVLPECHSFENLEIFDSLGLGRSYPGGLDAWSFHVVMPVVEPKYERRNHFEILSDLADRVGIRAEFNGNLETALPLKSRSSKQTETESHTIVGPDDRISSAEFTNRVLKHYFGNERDLAFFRDHGFVTWEKKPEECYWRYSVNARVPIYYEFIERDREQVQEMAEKIGIHMDWEHYTALPSYFPSCIYAKELSNSEFDLIAVSYRVPFHSHRFSAENPWIDEISSTNPYAYNIVMNTNTAKTKRIAEGDIICVQSYLGGELKGSVKLVQAIHPQVLGIVTAGSWAKGRPIARGKGVNFNELLRISHKLICPVSGAPEIAARVKAYRL